MAIQKPPDGPHEVQLENEESDEDDGHPVKHPDAILDKTRSMTNIDEPTEDHTNMKDSSLSSSEKPNCQVMYTIF